MDTTAKILRAIEEVNNFTGADWAPIAAVRDTVGGQRVIFDQAMIELAMSRKVIVIAEENQKMITAADDFNGVKIGGEIKHLVMISQN